MGASTTYTQEQADAIVAALEEGVPLAQTCRKLEIGRTTVYDWQREFPEFAERIVGARVRGFDAIAEECLAIADDSSQDTKIVGEDEREVCNTEFVQRAKLRIETRLKLLAKWDPKRFGEKVALVGGDPEAGDQPIQTAVDVSGLTHDQLRALAAVRLAK